MGVQSFDESHFQKMVYSLCLTLLMIWSSLWTVLEKDGIVYVNNVGEVFSSDVTVGEFCVSLCLQDHLQFMRIGNSDEVSMTRRMLLLFLLRSGIETNPGPPKKKEIVQRAQEMRNMWAFLWQQRLLLFPIIHGKSLSW